MSKLIVLFLLVGVLHAFISEDSSTGSSESNSLEDSLESAERSSRPTRYLQNETENESESEEEDEEEPEEEEEDSNVHNGIRRVDLGTDLSGTDTADHIIRKESDEEEDMKLITPTVNSYGKLKYKSLPVVEDNMVDDLAHKIMTNDAYRQMLGNPSQEELEKYLRQVLKKASQKTMQEQIMWKLLGIKAYYKKYIASLTNADQKQQVIDFIVKLLQSKTDEDLSGQKTIDLNKYFDRLVYLLNDPDVSAQFQTLLDSFTPTTAAPITASTTPPAVQAGTSTSASP